MNLSEPTMYFWQRLWRDVQRVFRQLRPPGRVFRFDETLAFSLRRLAAREKRSEQELAAELLEQALAQRLAAETNLARWRSLTPREQEVTALVCLGYTNRQIAARLSLSPETVKTHVRNVLAKLGARSKAELRQALGEWDFSAWMGAGRPPS
jgi:DNA-binding NarL/FixJ family response regulator